MDKNDNSLRHFPPDLLTALGLPVVASMLAVSWVLSLHGSAWLWAAAASFGVAMLGAAMLFTAKLPLYFPSLIAVLLSGCATSRSPVSSLPWRTSYSAVELPRPNSGQFTTAQAQARKSEALTLTRTPMFFDWHRPFSGFSIHITPRDEVVVYDNPGSREGKVTVTELDEMLEKGQFFHDPAGGNPIAVLVTSERDPARSRTFPRVIDLLFRPFIQIYYLKSANPPVERTAG